MARKISMDARREVVSAVTEQYRSAKRAESRSAVQPHCGHPGPTKNWCSNLSGVLTVEHPVPKMDSV